MSAGISTFAEARSVQRRALAHQFGRKIAISDEALGHDAIIGLAASSADHGLTTGELRQSAGRRRAALGVPFGRIDAPEANLQRSIATEGVAVDDPRRVADDESLLRRRRSRPAGQAGARRDRASQASERRSTSASHGASPNQA